MHFERESLNFDMMSVVVRLQKGHFPIRASVPPIRAIGKFFTAFDENIISYFVVCSIFERVVLWFIVAKSDYGGNRRYDVEIGEEGPDSVSDR